MEKTIPRQFFDRIYGDNCDKNSLKLNRNFTNTSSSESASNSPPTIPNNGLNTGMINENHMLGASPIYINGFASFSEYIDTKF